MHVRELFSVLPEAQSLASLPDIEVPALVYDPLRVVPGAVFVAINIYTQLDKVEIPDGHERIDQAVAKGAAVVVLEKDRPVPPPATKVLVRDSRAALALLANKFYGYPSRQLKLIGVTGTNGKTTTTHVVESILQQRVRVGLIGTLYYKVNGVIYHSKDTTPEPPDLHAIFRQMVTERVDYCVFEVSSHGIDFHRVDGCQFDVAVFTNLTQDHLDYHGTLENYRRTKMRLFEWLAPDKHAVVNRDDPSADYFIGATKAKVLTYGVASPADFVAEDIRLSVRGTEYTLRTRAGVVPVRMRLLGMFNVYNALAAAAAAYSQGFDLDAIRQGLEAPIRVAGRFELIERGQNFTVVVDYAHTPDGMKNVLALARSLNPRRVLTVFGCGGDRDKEKRPIMGKIAGELSDLVIVTADNPRNEDPARIVAEIVAGIGQRPHQVILDRREAIAFALRQAGAGDIVLLLGKGHESTQTLRDRTIPFNDAQVAAELLDEMAV